MSIPEWREQVATYRRNAHTPLDSAVWAMRLASMLDKACDEIDVRGAWGGPAFERLIRRRVVTFDPAEAEQCCGLDRDDDGFCSIKPRHPIYVGGTA